MNITKQQVDELNAVVKIELEPVDYQPKVDEVIKKYQRTANLPGFRPGKVPAGIIKKMYGKSLLIEELNRILSDSLGRYIYDNKLEVIGSPLPKKNTAEQNFEDGKKFEFEYELGMAPGFEVKIPNEKFPFYVLKVEEKMLEDDISDIRRRYGKFSNPEISDETHILYGEFNELDETGNIKEGGNKTTTTLSIEMIRDVQKRKPFVGLKKNDTVKFNPIQTIGNDIEVAAMLKLSRDSAEANSDYQFTVMTINQVEKAELNQELFDKLYGEGNVKSEEEFRGKVREGIAAYFEKESDRKLKKDLKVKLLEAHSIPLPDAFLKRMLKAGKETEMKEHEFEHEYYHVTEDLRWNLIQNKIASSAGIEITEDEIKELSKQVMRQQFAQYGYYDIAPDRLEELSKKYLEEEGAFDKLERSLKESKVFDHLKTQVKLDKIELAFDAFKEKLEEKTAHEIEHHH